MPTPIIGKELLEGLKSPALPYGPPEYLRQYQDDLNNILRLYFNQIDNVTTALLDVRGARFLSSPFGVFQSVDDQTAGDNVTAYPIYAPTTDYSNGITVVSGSRFTVEQAGIYNLQFSCQLANTTNAIQDIDIWFRTATGNIANSNTRFGLSPRKASGDPYHTVAAINFFTELGADEYIEMAWCTTDVGALIKAYPAGTNPTRPFIPSVIVTMSFVSRR